MTDNTKLNIDLSVANTYTKPVNEKPMTEDEIKAALNIPPHDEKNVFPVLSLVTHTESLPNRNL